MHQSIIRLKNNLSQEKIREINGIVDFAFDTDRDTLTNISDDPMVIIHQSIDNCWAVYAGINAFAKLGFLDDIESWDCIDDKDPRESFDALEKSYYMKANNWRYVPRNIGG